MPDRYRKKTLARYTNLSQMRKLYGDILINRKENNLPMTLDEKYFLNNGVRKKT